MEQEYIDIFNKYRSRIDEYSASVMNVKRQEHFEQFVKIGFPDKSLEDYKYTDLKKPLSLDYGINILQKKFEIDPNRVFKCDVPGIDGYTYFLVNESFYTESEKYKLPEGVIIDSMRTASEKYPELVEKYYGKLTDKKSDGLIAFNGAFAQDGFFMYVPKNVQMDRPVQLVNTLNANQNLMVANHNLIIIEQGAKAQLLICDHTISEAHFFANRVTEVFVDENATYEHYYLENVHKNTTCMRTLLVDQKASSNVLGNIINLHNGVTRNNIEIALNGENCETLLCGMVLGDQEQVVDNFTSILHNKPHCHSTELFKHILDDHSRGGFTGRLYVMKDAQKTAAFQTNKNIILSGTAKAQTRPQLEIYADDVKCSHGATIGQLDESALFYMQQRGIPKKEARTLLMNAFVADVISNIRIPALQERIRHLIEKRLRGELAKCEGCAIH